MWKDPIVKQVRKVREEHAAEFNFDIKVILEDARKRQVASKHRVVSFVVTPKAMEGSKTA